MHLIMKFKKVRTLKDILDDTRVAKVGQPEYYSIDDVIWREQDGFRDNDSYSYWVSLADGYNCDGSSVMHEATVKDLCDCLNLAVEVGCSY